MNNNGTKIFIMKKTFVDFCVSIFSKSRDLPEPVSEPEPEPEPGFKVGTGTGIGTGKFLTGSATLLVTSNCAKKLFGAGRLTFQKNGYVPEKKFFNGKN